MPSPTPNTIAYADRVRRFFRLATTERVALVMFGNSDMRHNGNGWEAGFTAAAGVRYGLFGSGLIAGGGPTDFGDPAALPAAVTQYRTQVETTGAAIVAGGSTETNQFFAAHFFDTDQGGAYSTTAKAYFDAREGFVWTVHAATFATNGGKFMPVIGPNGSQGYADPRLFWPTPTISTNTGTNGMVRHVATMPADSTRTATTSWAFQPASQYANDNGGTPTGPLMALYTQFEQPGRVTGMSVASLLAIGGKPRRYDRGLLQASPAAALGYYFRETRRPLGQAKAECVVIQECQNSRNASNYPPVAQLSADTPAQYAANLRGAIDRVRMVYALNGWSTDDLYFLILGDHALSLPDDAAMVTYRTAAATAVCPANANTAAVDLSQIVNGAEMMALNYYTSPGEVAHLANDGTSYTILAGKVLDLLDPVPVGDATSELQPDVTLRRFKIETAGNSGPVRAYGGVAVGPSRGGGVPARRRRQPRAAGPHRLPSGLRQSRQHGRRAGRPLRRPHDRRQGQA